MKKKTDKSVKFCCLFKAGTVTLSMGESNIIFSLRKKIWIWKL